MNANKNLTRFAAGIVIALVVLGAVVIFGNLVASGHAAAAHQIARSRPVGMPRIPVFLAFGMLGIAGGALVFLCSERVSDEKKNAENESN